jgi:hypothetical protein
LVALTALAAAFAVAVLPRTVPRGGTPAPGSAPLPPVEAGPVTIRWEVLRARGDDVTALTETPGALVNGDRVRVVCHLSRPSHVYLFWVESEGTVVPLHPKAGTRATAVETVAWPAAEDKGGAVTGTPGTELVVACAVGSPLTETEVGELEASLALPSPLPPLGERVVLIDGVPAGTRAPRKDRGIGETRPLVGSPVVSRLDALRRALPASSGSVSILAIPHAGGPSPAAR